MRSLEGNGVCEDLYYLLWLKTEQDASPSIRIPDTIVYKYGQPVHWYFTGKDGRLKKKLKQNVVNSKIEDGFTRHAVSDIIAYYISWAVGPGSGGQPIDGSQQIEYLNADGLRSFLRGSSKGTNGILQQFVESKGPRNSLIRATWSPKLCFLERRVNQRNLHDRRYGMTERAVTYDGPDVHSSAQPLRGTVLPTALKATCEETVQHVAEVSYHKRIICRMVLYFKLDASDCLWLLWSGSIRETPAGGDSSPNDSEDLHMGDLVRIPQHVILRLEANHSKGHDNVKPTNHMECPGCGEPTPSDRFYPVTYKTIIGHFGHLLSLAAADPVVVASGGIIQWPPSEELLQVAGGVRFASTAPSAEKEISLNSNQVPIPPILRSTHPSLTSDAYKIHRSFKIANFRDPLFLYKTTSLCEECFLGYAAYATEAICATSKSSLVDSTLQTLSLSSQSLQDERSYSSNRRQKVATGNEPTKLKKGKERKKTPAELRWEQGQYVTRQHNSCVAMDVKRPPTLPKAISSVSEIERWALDPYADDGEEDTYQQERDQNIIIKRAEELVEGRQKELSPSGTSRQRAEAFLREFQDERTLSPPTSAPLAYLSSKKKNQMTPSGGGGHLQSKESWGGHKK